ncbi:MAG: hypothetical protein OEV78_03485 [Spirochaetia bacterium]|nr:hypothetical protein [Spirochaetia bacterium]
MLFSVENNNDEVIHEILKTQFKTFSDLAYENSVKKDIDAEKNLQLRNKRQKDFKYILANIEYNEYTFDKSYKIGDGTLYIVKIFSRSVLPENITEEELNRLASLGTQKTHYFLIYCNKSGKILDSWYFKTPNEELQFNFFDFDKNKIDELYFELNESSLGGAYGLNRLIIFYFNQKMDQCFNYKIFDRPDYLKNSANYYEINLKYKIDAKLNQLVLNGYQIIQNKKTKKTIIYQFNGKKFELVK